MCVLDGTGSASLSTVEVVDCTEMHDAEVYASRVLADGAFPGTEAVAATALQECEAQFANFVGVTLANSDLTYQYFAPNAGSWTAGDRAVLCLIHDKTGPVTGSLENAAR